jgi:hypothetical protein
MSKKLFGRCDLPVLIRKQEPIKRALTQKTWGR